MAAVLCVSRSGIKPLAVVTLPMPHTIKPRAFITPAVDPSTY